MAGSSSLASSKASGSSNSNSLDNYEKVRVVGKGAFGTAVLYKRLSDSEMVVLKEISLSELSAPERQMALNEVQVLSVLHHPNIISYLGSFEKDGLLVIEMEYAEGGTLSEMLAGAKGPLPEQRILDIFRQVVAAIQYMHDHSILHRDLKTVNVFLTKDQIIKVGDFGISKVMNTKSQAQTVLGTPYYISPEMCEGKQYDEKSDMWALGCVLYELACREKTFQGSNLPALVNKIMKGVYEPLPSIYSSGLKLLVKDLLQMDPNLRPPASVVASRVSNLYEKIVSKLNGHHINYKEVKIRSVLYQLSGQGPSFQMCPVQLPPTAKVLNIAVGTAHYIALTSDMLVYSWGEGKRGELGHESKPDWQEEPKLIQSLVSKSVALVSAGNGISAFVTDSGMVFTCGRGDWGTLGHGHWDDVSSPKLIDKLLNVDVMDISCGDDHVACLTRDGNIYAWGLLASGMRVCSPEILVVPSNVTVAKIKCGPNVTGVITNCGRLLVAGSNEGNRLALDSWLLGWRRVAAVKELTLVQSVKRWKLKDVSFGRNHTALLTCDGRVVTVGSGADFQLGHNYKNYPAVVEAMDTRFSTMVVCGPTFTLISTDENALYFWGTRFTQGKEVVENSKISMSTIETQVVIQPQEVLALYCSEKQISEGLTITVSSLSAQWHCILVLVDTTAPYSRSEQPKQVQTEQPQDQHFDSLGPVPDWIKEELAKATHDWPGITQPPQSSRRY